MKLTKSQLKELIRNSIREVVSEADVMDKVIKYKDKDGNEKEATVGGILKKGKDHPAHKQAKSVIDKGKGKPKVTKKAKISADPFGDKPPFKGGKPSKDDDEFDVGGPAYPKVPKGVKTSADAKGVMKARDLAKQAMDTDGKYKHPAMNDVDWGDEIDPDDMAGLYDDMKKDMTDREKRDIENFVDKYQAAHDEEDYDQAEFIQKRLEKRLKDITPMRDKAKSFLGKQKPASRPLKMQKDVNDSTSKKLGFKNTEDLAMGGSADELNDFMDSVPDAGQDMGEAEEMVNYIRDNEQGVRNDDEDVVQNYRKAFLDMMSKPGVKGKGSGKSAKDIEKQSMKAADDANTKMDRAELADAYKKLEKMKKELNTLYDKGDREGMKKKNAEIKKFNKTTILPLEKKLQGESVKESTRRKYTIKEVRMWMKKLEENRYKKVYNSDARRVAWMVNNEGRKLDEMPKSMKKKWTKAQYGRERYLAKEFLKSKSEQLSEQKLRKQIRGIIKETIRASEARFLYIPKKDIKRAMKVVKSMPFKLRGKVEIQKKPSDKVRGYYAIITTKYLFDAVVEYLAGARIDVKTISKGKM